MALGKIMMGLQMQNRRQTTIGDRYFFISFAWKEQLNFLGVCQAMTFSFCPPLVHGRKPQMYYGMGFIFQLPVSSYKECRARQGEASGEREIVPIPLRYCYVPSVSSAEWLVSMLYGTFYIVTSLRNWQNVTGYVIGHETKWTESNGQLRQDIMEWNRRMYKIVVISARNGPSSAWLSMPKDLFPVENGRSQIAEYGVPGTPIENRREYWQQPFIRLRESLSYSRDLTFKNGLTWKYITIRKAVLHEDWSSIATSFSFSSLITTIYIPSLHICRWLLWHAEGPWQERQCNGGLLRHPPGLLPQLEGMYSEALPWLWSLLGFAEDERIELRCFSAGCGDFPWKLRLRMASLRSAIRLALVGRR